MIPITYALPLPLPLSFIPLNKCPAFNSFYNKVLARGQGFIGVRAARLSPSLVQVTVQPQTKLSTARKKDRIRGDTLNYKTTPDKYSLSRSDGQTLGVALDKVQVLAGPVEHLEAGIELEEQTLAGAVKVVRDVQRARG